jgi:hypothetical protein
MRVACELRRVPRVMLQTQALGRSSPGVADDESVRLRAHMWHSGRGACSMQPIWASISLNHIFALATALGAAGPDLTMGMCGGLERSQGRGCIARAVSGAARSSKCLVPLMVVRL